MVKNLVIAALAVSVLILAAVVARLENFHYASVVGMCSQYKPDDPIQNSKRHQCLHDTATRTSSLWHLLYSLKDWD